MADDMGRLAASMIAAKHKALEKSLAALHATSTRYEFARAVQHKFRRACDQLPTCAFHSGQLEPTNNACRHALLPSVIQREVTNGYRVMRAAIGEADMRTVVDTARLRPGANTFRVVLQVVTVWEQPVRTEEAISLG